MASLNQVTTLYGELQKEWAKPAKNLKQCGELLDQLKVKIAFGGMMMMICRNKISATNIVISQFFLIILI